MKIRSGFVSNSSSSSFVVRRYSDSEPHNKSKLCLSPTQVKKLEKNGFRLDLAYYPHQINEDYSKEVEIEPDWMKIANYTKYVVCNQDDEIHFLLKNRISFIASCHYDHESLVYDGKSDKFLIAQNFGKQAEMSGGTEGGVDFEPWKGQQAVVKTTGKAYLKKYENT